MSRLYPGGRAAIQMTISIEGVTRQVDRREGKHFPTYLANHDARAGSNLSRIVKLGAHAQSGADKSKLTSQTA
jgi:hypothetical protein